MLREIAAARYEKETSDTLLTQEEFEALLVDPTKRIEGNISWTPAPDHSPAQEFRRRVISAGGYPLFIQGCYNSAAGKLSYTLIHRQAGRVYALDLGADHRNPPPDREKVGEKHKHSWTEEWGDRKAYVPADITEPWSRPVEVWSQFCEEARIRHEGTMTPLVPLKEVLP